MSPRIVFFPHPRTSRKKVDYLSKETSLELPVMRSWIFISILGSIGAVFQCDIRNSKPDRPFPNVVSEGIKSYQMSVEYTILAASYTGLYTEYYDKVQGKGRVDSQEAGDDFSYIYWTASWEAWDINRENCVLKNITDIPEFYKYGVTDWMYMKPDERVIRTMGPSAMFKNAYEAWNNRKMQSMVYMGVYETKIRGYNAHHWRRCNSPTSYIDYFFKADDEKSVPLRVFTGGEREGLSELSEQQYEILSFQPYISQDLRPFELPIGKGCTRSIDTLQIPDFINKDLQFRAEVTYGTDKEATQYYSSLLFALDLSSEHLAYHYTPWSQTKKEDGPDVEDKNNVICDTKNGYVYKTPLDTRMCAIYRSSSFIPEYELPNDGGSMLLIDPYILFPNSEFIFITEGTIRGLRVNIFEVVVEGYLIYKNDSFDVIPKAIISHAYLQDGEVQIDSVKNSLVQVQMHFSGRKDMNEIVTFNFFGFTTKLQNRSSIFGIQKCFGSDDYLWVTIGFVADKGTIQGVIDDVPDIESSLQNAITQKLKMNAVRVPVIKVDVKDELIVSLMILEKPPVILDYMDPVRDHTILETTQLDVEDFESCATRCLETENNCWGFAMCGAVCHFGTGQSKEVGQKRGCDLYKRFDMQNFIPSLGHAVKNIRRQIEQNEFSLMLKGKNDKTVQIDGNYLKVTYPGEEDEISSRFGSE